MTPRVEQFVRECQWFAGESSLVAHRDEQLRLLRNFLVRLPDAADRAEALIFRGILVDVAVKWSRHVHMRFHGRQSGESCALPLLEDLTSSNGDRIASYKWIFERWATAFLDDVGRRHLLSPGARAKDIIDARFAEPFQLRDLARMTGCTSVQLRMSFKQEFGVSLREYRTRARVLDAAKLVTGSDVKIAAIAASAGFRSKRNFYEAFRRAIGCTPSEMRRRAALQRASDVNETMNCVRMKSGITAGSPGRER